MTGEMVMVKPEKSHPVHQNARRSRDPADGPSPAPAGPHGAYHLPPAGRVDDEEGLPKFGWRDVVAFTIAAYQLLLPIILACFGLLIAVYLIMRYL